MMTQTTKTGQPGFLGKTIALLLGWLVCIVIPAGVTAAAPVSWIKFQRQGDRVTARAEVCTLFFIPYRTLTVDPVISVGQRSKAGSVTRHRQTGTDRYTTSETEGFLLIQGLDGQEAAVSVTPFNINSVLEKSEAFLKNPQATELKLFVVANWKFSILFGGLASMLTAAYIFGVVVTLGQFLCRILGFAGKGEADHRPVSGLP